MVETRGQRLRRHATLATYLCPDAGHLLPGVPSDCPFGHRRRGRRGGTEPADNLRSVPEGICLNHIKQWNCVNGTEVGCASGLHPTLLELSDLDAFLVRANPPRPQHQQGQCVDADSVTCSLAQLKLDSAPPGGPINRLPNELLAKILARLDMQQLVRSAAMVCKRWRAAVCSIGHTKKSIHLSYWSDADDNQEFGSNTVKRFFGDINLSAYTYITFRPSFATQLPNFFPNLDAFVIELPGEWLLRLLPQLPASQVTTLSLSHMVTNRCTLWEDEFETLLTLLNQFVALKRLDFQVQPFNDPELSMATLAPTLARLELFTCGIGCVPDIVSNLGASCTRVTFGARDCYNYFNCDHTLHQWHSINGQWLANLTHLALLHVGQIDRNIEYLSTHAPSLQVLSFQGNDYVDVRMTSHMIGHLARLKHLTEFDLIPTIFDLPELHAACRNFRLARLIHLRSWTLVIFELVQFANIDQVESSRRLASVLSAILPNVEQLVIQVMYYQMDHPVSYEIVRGVELHLERFPRLKKHSFVEYEYE